VAPEVTSEVGSSISPRDPELINHIISVQIDIHVSADQSPSKADEKVVTVDSNEEIIVVGRQKLQGPISSTLQGYVRRILEQILQSESVQQEECSQPEQVATILNYIRLPRTTKESLVVAEINKPAGRLKIFLENWKSIISDSRILTWIKGYAIPFSKSVFQDLVPKEQAEIREHIEKLILKSAIVAIRVRSSFYLEFS